MVCRSESSSVRAGRYAALATQRLQRGVVGGLAQQRFVEPVQLVVLECEMAIGDEDDDAILRPVDAGDVERVDPHHAQRAGAGQHACVVRLGQVLHVVQGPAG